MSRIHPTESKCFVAGKQVAGESGVPTIMTVWKKSSMAFQGTDGFSVFDGNGRLAFRVDNYSRRSKYLSGDIILMDGDGEALITLRPQIFSMHDRWNAYAHDQSSTRTDAGSHLFSIKRRSTFLINSEVDVLMGSTISRTLKPDFWSDGCFTSRCCKIWSSSGEVAAVITKKKVTNSVILGNDVFSLIINHGFNCELIVAFVVVLDRICFKSILPSCVLDSMSRCKMTHFSKKIS